MKTLLAGEVVETEANPYDFNGRQGIAYGVFVRGEGQSAREGATRVRVSAVQFGAFSVGEHVELPVDVQANTVERMGMITGARLSVTLSPDWVKPAHAGKG